MCVCVCHSASAPMPTIVGTPTKAPPPPKWTARRPMTREMQLFRCRPFVRPRSASGRQGVCPAWVAASSRRRPSVLLGARGRALAAIHRRRHRARGVGDAVFRAILVRRRLPQWRCGRSGDRPAELGSVAPPCIDRCLRWAGVVRLYLAPTVCGTVISSPRPVMRQVRILHANMSF